MINSMTQKKKNIPTPSDSAPEKGTCFVVMGFGKKTDYETGRVLDLDHSYLNLIKPAAEAAGVSEAKRFTTELTAAIQKIMASDPELRRDSPVYKFIERLTPPSIAAEVRVARAEAASASSAETVGAETPAHSELMQRVDE